MRDRTLADLVSQLGNLGDQELFRHRTEFRAFSWSYRRVARTAGKVAAYLGTQGIARGDRVMIWAPNSPEWAVALLGCLLDGVVAVPVDPRHRPPVLREIQRQTRAKLLFTSHLRGDPGLGIPALPLEDLEETLWPLAAEDLRAALPTLEDPAEILYPWSDPSRPEAVTLTHHDLLRRLESFQPLVPAEPEYRFLSVLPLSDPFEQIGGLLLPITRGGSVVHVAPLQPSMLLRSLEMDRPNVILASPRILHLLRELVARELKDVPVGLRLTSKLLALDPVDSPESRRRQSWPTHRILGGNLKYVVIEDGALSPESCQFWESLGVELLHQGQTPNADSRTDRGVVVTAGQPQPPSADVPPLWLAEGNTASLRRLVAEASGVSSRKPRDSTTLGSDLGLGPVELLGLASRLEVELGIDLPEEELSAETTVAELEALVQRREPPIRRGRRPGWEISRPAGLLRRVAQELLLIPAVDMVARLQVEGIDSLRRLVGPFLLVSNQGCPLDPPAILRAMPSDHRAHTVVAAGTEQLNGQGAGSPAQRRLSRYLASLLLGAFPLPRTRPLRPDLQLVGDLANRGWNVLLLLEPGNTETGQADPFNLRIAMLVSRLRLPVVPVRAEGLKEILPEGKRLPIPGKATVRFGMPLLFRTTASPDTVRRELEESLRDLDTDLEQQEVAPAA